MTGIGFIRRKESDRIGGGGDRAAPARRRRRGGARRDAWCDPPAPACTALRCHLRRPPLAMAFSLVGLRVPGVSDRRPRLRGQDVPDVLVGVRAAPPRLTGGRVGASASRRSRRDVVRAGPAGTVSDPAPTEARGGGALTTIVCRCDAGVGDRRSGRFRQVHRGARRWPAASACSTSTPGRCTGRSTFAALRRSIDVERDPAAVAALAAVCDLRVRPRGRLDRRHRRDRGDPWPSGHRRGVSRRRQPRRPRRVLVDRQRAWAGERGGAVLEGRDIGTVVFPDARAEGVPHRVGRVRASRVAPARARSAPTPTQWPTTSCAETAATRRVPWGRWPPPSTP